MAGRFVTFGRADEGGKLRKTSVRSIGSNRAGSSVPAPPKLFARHPLREGQSCVFHGISGNRFHSVGCVRIHNIYLVDLTGAKITATHLRSVESEDHSSGL